MYDESNSITSRISNVGTTRYIWDISIDYTAKTVTLYGQGNGATTITWSELGFL